MNARFRILPWRPATRPAGALVVLLVVALGAALVAAGPAIAPGSSLARAAATEDGPGGAGDRRLRLEAIETRPDEPGLAAALGDLIDLAPGDPIEADDLRAARRTIARAGWFETFEVYTAPGSARGQLILHVDGDLDRGVRFETGFGHEPLDGWYLNLVGASMRHVFGPASVARANVQLGQRRAMTRFEVEARRVGGSRLDLLFDASSGNEEWLAYQGDRRYVQGIDRDYTRVGARLHLDRTTSLALWIGASRADPGDLAVTGDTWVEPPSDLVGPDQDAQHFADLRLDLVRDRRDRVQPWRRGSWTLLRTDVSRPREGGDAFVRTRAAFRGAMPLPGQQALALRADAAWADRGTPYHLRPVFGGQGSVRGFRDASLSGGRGARAMAAAGLEWRVPLLPRGGDDARVHGVVFADTGRFVDADGDLGRWSTALGWGLRVRLPWVERIALDAGIPLTPTATEDAFWVHGSLGFGF